MDALRDEPLEAGERERFLSVVKHLVRRLSGQVSAADRPEGGAVFTIRVPYQAVIS